MIDWNALLLVSAVSLVAATCVVVLFALGLRLLAVEESGRGRARRIAAFGCFALCGAAVLVGVLLLVPLPL